VSDPSSIATLRTIATTAMIGSDRAGAKPAELLKRAAAHGLRARAGSQGMPAPEPGAAGAADPTPPANGAATATLMRLLADPDAALIEEWAAIAAAAGVRVADPLVPLVLAWCCAQPTRDATVAAVCGIRGQWLASLNPDWSRAITRGVTADVDAQWQTGTATERQQLLGLIRRDDPAKARTLVALTWKDDNADERARFIAMFAERLSDDDEAFLTTALADRSKQVRAHAAQLLAKLPGSALAARMLDRAAACCTIVPGRKGVVARLKGKAEPAISIEPPAKWEPAFANDGLEENASDKGGQRAWWLQQIMSVVPPIALAKRLGVTREELVAAAMASDYASDLIRATLIAAASSDDIATYVDMMELVYGGKPRASVDIDRTWSALAPQKHEQVLLQLFQRPTLNWEQRLSVLNETAHRWSAGFSLAALASLAASMPATLKKQNRDWLAHHVVVIARVVHPSASAAVEELVQRLGDDRPPSVQRSIDRLRLRVDMHKEFAS
jgi:hypothetical protein